jgi:hypothetical protein
MNEYKTLSKEPWTNIEVGHLSLVGVALCAVLC